MISERRKRLLAENISSTACRKSEMEDLVGQKTKKTFLDILLQSTIDGRPLSDLDIREEVDTFTVEV